MPAFSKRSLDNLKTCDPRLQEIAEEAIKYTDFTVIEGHRSKARQNALYDARPQRTKVRWPNSKHNSEPSQAMDIVPYPIDWKDLERFYFLAGVIVVIAKQRGIKIRWGGDWDSDGDFNDQRFIDLPHFELV